MPALANLPTGRAVLGGLLVALAALGLFTAWRQATAKDVRTYLVASEAIPANTAITAKQIATVKADITGAPAQRLFTNPDALIGKVTIGPLASGELITVSEIEAREKAPPAFEYAVSLSSEQALAGQLHAGEKVAVMVSDDRCTTVLSVDAVVQRIDGQGDTLSASKYIVNLRLANATQVLRLAHVGRDGAVSLARSDLTVPDPVCKATR
jgi:hypothetical protein